MFAKYIAPFAKAHLAGLGTAAGMVLADCGGNFGNIAAVTGGEWTAAACVALGVGLGVGMARNVPFVAPVPAPAAVAVSQDSGDEPASPPVPPA